MPRSRPVESARPLITHPARGPRSTASSTGGVAGASAGRASLSRNAVDAPQSNQEKLRAKRASVLRRRPVHFGSHALVPQHVRVGHRAQERVLVRLELVAQDPLRERLGIRPFHALGAF